MMMGISVHPQCMQAKVPSPQTSARRPDRYVSSHKSQKKEVGPLYGSLESIMQQPVSVQARGSPVTWRCMPPFPPAGHFRLGVIVLLQTVDGGWDVWTTGEGSGEEA